MGYVNGGLAMKRLWIFMAVLVLVYCAMVDRAYSRIRRYDPLFRPRSKVPEITMGKKETIYIWNIIKELDLTQEQSLKLLPVINQVEKNKKDCIIRKRELIGRLKETQSKRDKAEIEMLLEEMDELDEFVRTQDRLLDKYVKDILTPEQRARYIIFKDKGRKRR